MKTILLTLITITMSTGLFASATKTEDTRLCKVFQEKAISYKETMRNDVYAQKTLQSYENRAKIFCSK